MSKTIEVTDEMYDSLMELSKEMTSQDMLGTRMPHMFQIETTKEVAAYEGNGTETWVDGDGSELRTDEDIKEYIINHHLENDSELFYLDGDEAVCEATFLFDQMDEGDIEAWLEEHGYRRVEVTTIKKYENTFFTAKACKLHISKNGYHYDNPRCYLNHAFRNPEMELVSTFLCELSGGKLYV
jgi:hypothetical protein